MSAFRNDHADLVRYAPEEFVMAAIRRPTNCKACADPAVNNAASNRSGRFLPATSCKAESVRIGLALTGYPQAAHRRQLTAEHGILVKSSQGVLQSPSGGCRKATSRLALCRSPIHSAKAVMPFQLRRSGLPQPGFTVAAVAWLGSSTVSRLNSGKPCYRCGQSVFAVKRHEHSLA